MAGSERISKSQIDDNKRLSQAANINKSLLTLTKVIK